MQQEDKLLSTVEAARYMGLHPGTLRNYRYMGIGPAFRRGRTGQVRYELASLQDWFDEQKPLAGSISELRNNLADLQA